MSLGKGRGGFSYALQPMGQEATTVYGVPKKRTAALQVKRDKIPHGRTGFIRITEVAKDFPTRASIDKPMKEKPKTTRGRADRKREHESIPRKGGL